MSHVNIRETTSGSTKSKRLKRISHVNIRVSTGHAECPCCGGYLTEEITIKQDDKVVLHHKGDNHASSTTFWAAQIAPLKLVLTALGHEVTTDEEEIKPELG